MPHVVQVAKQAHIVIRGTGMGPPGPPLEQYIHTQSVPSASWVIGHNLNKVPSIVLVDDDGKYMIPDADFDSLTQVTLYFATPTTGKVYLQ